MISRKVFLWLAGSALFAAAVALGLVTALMICRALKPGANAADKECVGESDDPIAECRKVVELNPTDAEAHCNLGVALYDKGQLDEAIQECRTAIELDPNNAEAHSNLGRALAVRNQGGKALFVAYEFNSAICNHTLTGAPADQNQLEEAIAEIQKAIELDPKCSSAYFNLGVALSSKHQWDEAIAEFRKSIELDPNYAVAHCNLGSTLAVKSQWEEAAAEFRKTIELDSKCADAHNGLGNAFRIRNQLDEAAAEFRLAIELNPNFAEAHNGLGNTLRDKNQLDEAVVEFRKAVELDPKAVLAHCNLGRALADKNQSAEAVAEFRNAIEVDPNYVEAHNGLGNALRDSNEVDEAIAEFRKAIEIEPKDGPPHYNLAQALAAKSQVEQALAEFRKASELDPKDADAHRNIGLLLGNKKLWDDAIAEFRKTVELNPKDAYAHWLLGCTLRAKKQLGEAIAEFRKAGELDPKTLDDRDFNLVNALGDNNQLDEALAEIRKAIDRNPKDASAHYSLGRVTLAMGRFAEAKASAQQAWELFPEQSPERQLALHEMDLCERLLALAVKRPDVVAGQAPAADNSERLCLVELCWLQHRYVAASRLYGDALAADPKLAVDSATSYPGAQAAAQAVAGQGTDAGKLEDKERARLCQQALGLLRAELDLFKKMLEGAPAEQRAQFQQMMVYWQNDAALAAIRDQNALTKLPADERAACQKLWADVATLLKNAVEVKVVPPFRPDVR